jgi:hypothetical protein
MHAGLETRWLGSQAIRQLANSQLAGLLAALRPVGWLAGLQCSLGCPVLWLHYGSGPLLLLLLCCTQ